jgi:hypothetical protein
MLGKFASVLVAAIVAGAFSTVPAEAAKKAKKRYPAATTSSRSLDGRVTGYPRTCGYDYYVYDDRGVPMGPYCH